MLSHFHASVKNADGSTPSPPGLRPKPAPAQPYLHAALEYDQPTHHQDRNAATLSAFAMDHCERLSTNAEDMNAFASDPRHGPVSGITFNDRVAAALVWGSLDNQLHPDALALRPQITRLVIRSGSYADAACLIRAATDTTAERPPGQAEAEAGACDAPDESSSTCTLTAPVAKAMAGRLGNGASSAFAIYVRPDSL